MTEPVVEHVAAGTKDLTGELATFLHTLNEGMMKGGQWALDQAPLVVQEKILFGRIEEPLLFGAWVGLTGVAVYALRHWIKKPTHVDKYGDFSDIPKVFGLVLSGLATVGGGMATIDALATVVKVYFAPRLYILEWIGRWATGH